MAAHLPKYRSAQTIGPETGQPLEAGTAKADAAGSLRLFVERGLDGVDLILKRNTEAQQLRQRAERLMCLLQEQQAELDAALQRTGRTDRFSAVTGASSIEQAIIATERLLDSIDRATSDCSATTSYKSAQLMAIAPHRIRAAAGA